LDQKVEIMVLVPSRTFGITAFSVAAFCTENKRGPYTGVFLNDFRLAKGFAPSKG
jgi:hypothetical protein